MRYKSINTVNVFFKRISFPVHLGKGLSLWSRKAFHKTRDGYFPPAQRAVFGPKARGEREESRGTGDLCPHVRAGGHGLGNTSLTPPIHRLICKMSRKRWSLQLCRLCSLTAMSGEPVARSWFYGENWKCNPADRGQPGEAGT